MGARKRIRTLLYGDERLTSAELEVLHTPAMQRLYGLKQLGLADRIFIDASHARIHHVVGVLQQVDKLVSAIINNLRRSDRTLNVGTATTSQTFAATKLAILVQKRRPVIRFIGLLHDLTHAPFGHTVEDEIGLVESKHDEPGRQADAFHRLLCQLIAWLCVEGGLDLPDVFRSFLAQAPTVQPPNASDVAALAKRLFYEVEPQKAKLSWRLSQAEIAEMLAHLGCAMTSLIYLEALHEMELADRDLPAEDEYDFQIIIREALKGTPFEQLLDAFDFQPNRDAFMLDVVGNTVCADLLDYAQRDSRLAGLKLDYDSDRIAENFTLVALDAAAYAINHPPKGGISGATGRTVPQGRRDPFAGWCLRTAISLVSHKYRTDVPSELMNLLNVRFYLYERAVYHPTKCAADSMLGTALQLLGWREMGNGRCPSLPAHLRFVGDDVFLHDIRAALNFLIDWMCKRPEDELLEEKHLSELTNLDLVHSGLVPILLGLRLNSTTNESLGELRAARLLFDRLAARRYFRPVFRALPNSKDPRLQAGPDELAKFFLDADTRYQAERRIEISCQLPVGTVTIHCPARKTARKVANVLLTTPDRGVDKVRKLQDIGSLDAMIFGEHEKAVKAVEDMYFSMWRLSVYVAPEYLPQHARISKSAGRVIFQTIDVHHHFDENLEWQNDQTLEDELKQKASEPTDIPDVSDLSPLGELVGRIGDQLLESGRIQQIPAELLGGPNDVPAQARQRIEDALCAALQPQGGASKKPTASTERMNQLIAALKTYKPKPTGKEIERLTSDFRRRVSEMPSANFGAFMSQVYDAIEATREIDEQPHTVHKGNKFDIFHDLVKELLDDRRSLTSQDADEHDAGGGTN